VRLGDLEIYRLSLELSDEGWDIYQSLPQTFRARGSLWEVKHWFMLLHKRHLITKDQFDRNIILLDLLGKKLNGFIKNLNTK